MLIGKSQFPKWVLLQVAKQADYLLDFRVEIKVEHISKSLFLLFHLVAPEYSVVEVRAL